MVKYASEGIQQKMKWAVSNYLILPSSRRFRGVYSLFVTSFELGMHSQALELIDREIEIWFFFGLDFGSSWLHGILI